jgi:hypothetical protein
VGSLHDTLAFCDCITLNGRHDPLLVAQLTANVDGSSPQFAKIPEECSVTVGWYRC